MDQRHGAGRRSRAGPAVSGIGSHERKVSGRGQGDPMIQAYSAIARMRRDLTVSAIVKALLLGIAFFAVMIDAFRPGVISGSVVLAIIGGIWLALSFRSVKGSRMAAVSPA